MDENVNEKIKLIIIDKGITAIVVAIVVAVVTYFTNSNLEHQKINNTINATLANDFLIECESAWSKIYEIDIYSENLISEVRVAYLMNDYRGDIFSNKVILEKTKVLDTMRDSAYAEIRKKKTLLTEELVLHFGQYIGFQREKFEAEMNLENRINSKYNEETIEYIQYIRERLEKMRFNMHQAKLMAQDLYLK